MKRRITLLMLAGLALGACSGRETVAAPQGDTDGWVAPPEIETVTAAADGLVVSGQVAPMGRVVLTAPGGQAYAVGADEQGHFDLRLPRPAQDTLFAVETRDGQIEYPAPGRLLVSADPSGPIALLAAGAATRRLDAGPALDAVDSDGRAAFLSGHATAGSQVEVFAGQAMQVTTGPGGRWIASVPGTGQGAVSVGDVVFNPAVGGSSAEDVLERAGAGWRIAWSGPGGARQSTWFPDRPR